MEMNCTLFDELTSSYKADRQRWGTLDPLSNCTRHAFTVVIGRTVPPSGGTSTRVFGRQACPVIAWVLQRVTVRPECLCVNCDLDREKKKEQERDELWKKLEELKLDSSSLFQNNSHRILSVQNNSNNSNNNDDDSGTQERSPPSAAADRDANQPDGSAEGGKNPCAKWEQVSAFYSLTYRDKLHSARLLKLLRVT